MRKGFAIRVLVTALALGCAVYTVVYGFHPRGRFPFKRNSAPGPSSMVAPLPGVALPPGIETGDRFELRQQSLATRAAFIVPIRPAETYTLQLRRGGRMITIAVKTIPASTPNVGLRVFLTVETALSLVLGLVTLWWGSDWAAWGLSLFAIAAIVHDVLLLPLPSLIGFAAIMFNWAVVAPAAPAGLYVAAWSLAGNTSVRVRQAFHSIFVIALIGGFGTLLAQYIDGIMAWRFDFPPASFVWWLALYLVSLLTPIPVLLAGYLHANARRRVRLRWAIWSFILFLGATAWHNLNNNLHIAGAVGAIAWGVAAICGLGGLLYGVLRKRVVPLSFVFNRGLVYGLTGAVIVGIFALVETIVQLTALGGNANLALNVAVSLVIGLGFDELRKRIDDLIERLLFRRKHIAETALDRFAHHCAFMEHRERLVNDAVQVVHKHVQAHGVALYERIGDAYLCVAQRGQEAFPEHLETDDRVFVTLRAELKETDLNGIGSAVGVEGYAFPMRLRGLLLGALICGARSEHYTPDERELLSRVAHEVGIALLALRAHEREVLIDAIASGTLDADTTRTRARALRVGDIRYSRSI